MIDSEMARLLTGPATGKNTGRTLREHPKVPYTGSRHGHGRKENRSLCPNSAALYPGCCPRRCAISRANLSALGSAGKTSMPSIAMAGGESTPSSTA